MLINFGLHDQSAHLVRWVAGSGAGARVQGNVVHVHGFPDLGVHAVDVLAGQCYADSEEPLPPLPFEVARSADGLPELRRVDFAQPAELESQVASLHLQNVASKKVKTGISCIWASEHT